MDCQNNVKRTCQIIQKAKQNKTKQNTGNNKLNSNRYPKSVNANGTVIKRIVAL